MIVCLDSGNSRIKWGVHDGAQWLAQGAVAHADVEQLARLLLDWPNPDKVVLANVAGTVAGGRIREQLGRWSPVFWEVTSEFSRCGVTNRYRNPEQLGVDRWCAIDTMNAEGEFLGGFILPGPELMRRSLARETAALPFANGGYAAYPQCTDDAIVSGVLEAQAGAIERAFVRLADGGACC